MPNDKRRVCGKLARRDLFIVQMPHPLPPALDTPLEIFTCETYPGSPSCPVHLFPGDAKSTHWNTGSSEKPTPALQQHYIDLQASHVRTFYRHTGTRTEGRTG